MNAAYLHLIVNHIPVVGFLLLLPLNILGLITSNRGFKILAASATIAMSLGTLPAYFSGDEAEEVIEHQANVDESTISEHEEYAETSLILAILNGAAGALVLLSLFKKITQGHFKKLQAMSLLLNCATATLMGLTAQHGGHILHGDITGGHEHSAGSVDQGHKDHDHDDDGDDD